LASSLIDLNITHAQTFDQRR